MEVSSIPVPEVPSPRITAPITARDPHGFQAPPVPVAPPEGPLEDILDKFVAKAPEWATEALWKTIVGASRHVFKQLPAGAPVPERNDTFRFAVIGDYGGGRKPLADVAANIAARNPSMIITTGDNVYYNGTEQDYAKKWDPPNMFGNLRRRFPVMPSLGNHDTRVSTDPYFARFPELNGARYYSYDAGGVHFVSLNTNESLAPGSPQFEWLKDDLSGSRSDWKVMYFHHPMYSGFPKDNGPLKGYLAPLIAQYGVDLVFSGHEHNYSRTKPLNENGTIEVLTGNGGHTLHPFGVQPQEIVAYRDVDFGHVEVEVRDDELIGRYIARDGSVRDTFTVLNRTPGAAVADAVASAQHVA